MRSANRYVDFSEEELKKALFYMALAEDTAAYEAGDYSTEQEHLRLVELLQEAADRIMYLRDGWADAICPCIMDD